jgi:hypothetical protein
MTFDLHLRGNHLSLDALLNHLNKYPDFQRRDFSGDDFGYSFLNPATGVYWYLTIDEHGPEDAQVESVCIRLNYNRPTFFALETLPVVESLCRHFQLLIEDPQEDSIGPASLEDLIKSWRIHNERAVKILKSQGMALNYMPEHNANDWWTYARLRETIATNLGDSVFVPEVFIIKRPSQEPFRMIVCPEGIRQLLPPSDVVMIHRSDSTYPGKADQGFVPFDLFLDLVAPYTSEYRVGTQAYRLVDPVKHPEVISMTRELDLIPSTSKHEQVGSDGFHDVVLN